MTKLTEEPKALDGGSIECAIEGITECVSNVLGYTIDPLDLHFVSSVGHWVYCNAETLLTLTVYGV